MTQLEFTVPKRSYKQACGLDFVFRYEGKVDVEPIWFLRSQTRNPGSTVNSVRTVRFLEPRSSRRMRVALRVAQYTKYTRMAYAADLSHVTLCLRTVRFAPRTFSF